MDPDGTRNQGNEGLGWRWSAAIFRYAMVYLEKLSGMHTQQDNHTSLLLFKK
jgi:hypothetical protein